MAHQLCLAATCQRMRGLKKSISVPAVDYHTPRIGEPVVWFSTGFGNSHGVRAPRNGVNFAFQATTPSLPLRPSKPYIYLLRCGEVDDYVVFHSHVSPHTGLWISALTSMFWSLVLAHLSICLTTVLSDSTNLALINLTPYALKQNGNPSSYQLKSWDKAFPAEVGKGATNSWPDEIIKRRN